LPVQPTGSAAAYHSDGEPAPRAIQTRLCAARKPHEAAAQKAKVSLKKIHVIDPEKAEDLPLFIKRIESLNRYQGNVAERVELALHSAALWDEVKDKLKQSGLSLSGGQQQRLCIARAIATEPEVLLMDEPCSALDPIATRRIEELMQELKQKYTIAVVTHNLQQAMRVADKTAFMYVDTSRGGRTGYLVEYGDTKALFENPTQEYTRQYIRGEFS